MKWSYKEDGEAFIEISAHEYIKNQPVKFDGPIRDLIEDIKASAEFATLEIELHGANIFHLDVRGLLRLIRDLYEFTKNRGFLKEIRIKGTGFLFRNLYFPASLIMPRSVRELIKLC